MNETNTNNTQQGSTGNMQNTPTQHTQPPAARTQTPKKNRSCLKSVIIILIIFVALLVVLGVLRRLNQASPEVTNNTANPTVLPATNTTPSTPGNITVGIEYTFPGSETAFKELGIPGTKFYPEDYYQWDKMQPTATSPIDYSKLDNMVKRYQANGMTNILVGLRYDAKWAARDGGKTVNRTNGIPKPEYQDEYEKWLTGIIERYDGDGKNDMPGLLAPIKQYEIGVEYSSYAPEPASEYVPFLGQSYKAAHAVYPDVQIAHAAFLAVNVFRNNPTSTDYKRVFDNTVVASSGMKKYAEIAAVLDKPEFFDVLNLHSIGDPTEIDRLVTWAKFEMNRRGYSKPIMISDTATNPFIAFGRANTCTGLFLGVMIAPATESDRCKIATYFTKLINNDTTALAFVRQFSAEDISKKIIIAAANNVTRIDAAFSEDIDILKGIGSAGAGNSAWGGLVDVTRNFITQERTVKAKFPGFYALKQTQAALKKYDSIERVATSNNEVRLYKVKNGTATTWIAWLEPSKVYLPGETIPTTTIALPDLTGSKSAEKLITKIGQTTAEKLTVDVTKVTLTPTPIFITQ